MLTRIGILGLGGVGGYFGGLLAKAYAESDQSIVFIARGETKSNCRVRINSSLMKMKSQSFQILFQMIR
jgi:ketopantoate reductase